MARPSLMMHSYFCFRVLPRDTEPPRRARIVNRAVFDRELTGRCESSMIHACPLPPFVI